MAYTGDSAISAINVTKTLCNCVVVNRDEGETQRNWFKRWMCMFHWMQTDYYRAKIHSFDGDGICKNCGIEEAIAGQECKVAEKNTK